MQSSEFPTIEKDGYRRLVLVKQGEALTSVHDLSLEIRCNQAVLEDVVVAVFNQVFLLQIADRPRQELRPLNEEEANTFIADHEKQLRNEYIPLLLEGRSLRIPGEWQTDLSYDPSTKIAKLDLFDAESAGNQRSFFTPENVQKIIAAVSAPMRSGAN